MLTVLIINSLIVFSYVRYKAIPTYPIFNKKEQKLADEYDQAIEQLRQEGKIKELEEKYFGEGTQSVS